AVGLIHLPSGRSSRDGISHQESVPEVSPLPRWREGLSLWVFLLSLKAGSREPLADSYGLPAPGFDGKAGFRKSSPRSPARGEGVGNRVNPPAGSSPPLPASNDASRAS